MYKKLMKLKDFKTLNKEKLIVTSGGFQPDCEGGTIAATNVRCPRGMSYDNEQGICEYN